MQAPQIVETNLKFVRPVATRKTTNQIVVHNSGGASGNAAQFHRFHIETRGWAGIAYHYVILPNGVIERGRPPALVGGHTLGHNLTTVGVCVVGNFDYQVPTPSQVTSLTTLLAWLCKTYGLDPEAIVGHRDLGATSCPGLSLYRMLPNIRVGVGKALCNLPVPDAVPEPQDPHLVRFGDHGTDVADVQKSLNRHGFDLIADGVFGPITLAAVCAFQHAHDLDPDGVVGPLTRRTLNDAP